MDSIDLTVNTGPSIELTVSDETATIDLSIGDPVTIELNVLGGGTGGSGMSASVYDPTEVAADVFDLSNAHSGTLDSPDITIDGGLL